MRRSRIARAAVAALLGCASVANADIIFSNIVIGGSLSAGAGAATGPFDIDFTLPSAVVGDPTDPVRTGTVTINYDAQSDNAIAQNTILLGVLGSLAGSGEIQYSQTVDDLVNPGVISNIAVTLSSNSDLPYTDTIVWDRPSTQVHVSAIVDLSALSTAEFDLANVSLIEQRFVPEPSALALLTLGAVAALRRRPAR